jgi:hypothetical protein
MLKTSSGEFGDFVIAVFAIWRIASFVYDPQVGGPWDVLHKFRHKIGMRYDETSNLVGDNVVAQGLTCSICAPIWLGAVWAALYSLFPRATTTLLKPFAIGALSSLIEKRAN